MTYLTQHRDQHLTDEQLCELLATPSEPGCPTATSLHLRTCSICQAELAGLRASFTKFRLATTMLAANPPALVQRVAVVEQTSSWRDPVWATSVAAAILLAVSVSLVHPGHKGLNSTSTPAIATAINADSDEALIEDIQRDLSTSIPPSLQPLAVTAASSASSIDVSTQN